VSKGNLGDNPDDALKDPSDLLLGKPNGTFVESGLAAGIVSFARGRGAALVDLNLDGLLDLVQSNVDQPVQVWRNVGSGDAAQPRPMGGWLDILLNEPGANHDAVGAWVEVRAGGRTMSREVTVGGGHISGQLGPIHFGLGDADTADVRVEWPDGSWGPWIMVSANQFATIRRGDTQAQQWLPPAASSTAAP